MEPMDGAEKVTLIVDIDYMIQKHTNSVIVQLGVTITKHLIVALNSIQKFVALLLISQNTLKVKKF